MSEMRGLVHPERVSNVTPGWYPAPQEPGLVRYWDGSAWGEERRPVAPRTPMRNGFAVAAFVLGILSLLGFLLFVLFPFAGVIPVVGIVLGVVGLRRWRTSGGRVFAHIGLWLSVFAMVAVAFGVANRISILS